MLEKEPNQQTKTAQQTTLESSHGTAIRTQAAFVNKLYKMLDDKGIQNLISWSDQGDLFSVTNPTAFSKSVLPQYFKHNNWQSFVRQLNMYGFHKVNDMIHSNLTSDIQTWEFKHPHFKKGEIEDLQNVKRKNTKPSFSSLPSHIPTVTQVLSDDEDAYGPMYKHILHIEDRLHQVTRSYEILKNETNSLKTALSRQQNTINEFASLLSNVLGEDGINPNKKELILCKLNDIQSTIYDSAPSDEVNRATNTSSDPYPHPHHHQQQTYLSSLSPHNSSLPIFDQSTLSQQHQRTNSLPNTVSTSSSRPHNQPYPISLPVALPQQTYPLPITKNRRLGFGRESHLLNPEPIDMVEDANNNTFKKRRMVD